MLQVWILLVLFPLNSISLLHTGLGSRDEANLVRKLFNGTVPYNPLIRPAVDISDVIHVKLSLSFIQLISVVIHIYSLNPFSIKNILFQM